MATGGRGGRAVTGTTNTTKSTVTEQISQAVQSTSNLLHLMQQSSPSQVGGDIPHTINALNLNTFAYYEIEEPDFGEG
ncbi:hypothetical protein V6N13_027996 [Hibiscus sabdariffa]|uniref:Uncharacterized protein n=1 Tax=Hibiscus sabdariffa TaxID=183260 RepID=A0ABR2CG61_9ROSI